MSGRSGYHDDLDNLDLGRWRGQVASALRGQRGQRFLRELIAALDALPEKRLIPDDLEKEGEVCALGSVGRNRGLDMSALDPHDHSQLSGVFDIPHQLIAEIEYLNDEGGYGQSAEGEWLRTPENRWVEVRAWAERNLKPDAVAMTDEPTQRGK